MDEQEWLAWAAENDSSERARAAFLAGWVARDQRTTCGAICEHGGSCNRYRGHVGPHETHGTSGQVMCSWSVPESVDLGPS